MFRISMKAWLALSHTHRTFSFTHLSNLNTSTHTVINMKSQTIKKVENVIAKMIRNGRPRIHYSEIMSKCGVSPTYAREILRTYALTNKFQYDKGYLIAI